MPISCSIFSYWRMRSCASAGLSAGAVGQHLAYSLAFGGRAAMSSLTSEAYVVIEGRPSDPLSREQDYHERLMAFVPGLRAAPESPSGALGRLWSWITRTLPAFTLGWRPGAAGRADGAEKIRQPALKGIRAC